jgi:mono/diheme cytochrome c family protein
MSPAFRLLLVVAMIVLAPRESAAEPDVPEADAPEDYLLHCSACHRADGTGVKGVTPSLHGIGSVFAANGGRAYLVQVPGVAQAPLSDARLARLLNWVLPRFAGIEARPAYQPAEVGELRRAPLRDPIAARTALGID